MQRTCLTCQERLRGRSDQRFCSDYCRNRFHNTKKKEEFSFYRKVNQILRKNRHILHHFVSNYQLNISIEDLQAFGFHLDYCTALRDDHNQKTIFYCYDMAYQQSEDGMITIRPHYSGRTIPSSNDS